MIIKCPVCQATVNVPSYIGDYVHSCDDFPRDSVLGKEDVAVVGKWTDYTGSGIDPELAKNPQVAGLADKLQANVDAKLEHPERVPDRTDRGNPADTTRPRSRLTYIEFRNR